MPTRTDPDLEAFARERLRYHVRRCVELADGHDRFEAGEDFDIAERGNILDHHELYEKHLGKAVQWSTVLQMDSVLYWED